MNPHACRVALRPRGSFETFDLAIALVRDNPRVWIQCTALFVGVPCALAAIAAIATEGSLWVLVATTLISFALPLPFTALAARQLFDPNVQLSDVVRDLAERPVLWSFIAVGDFILFLFIPIFLLWVPQIGVSFLPECLWLERAPLRALPRAATLASAAPLPAITSLFAARLLLPIWLVAAVDMSGVAIWQTVLQAGQPPQLAEGSLAPWTAGIPLLAAAVAGAWRLLLYVDARTRSEGWDLQVSLRALALSR